MEQSYKEKYEKALEKIKNLIDKDHNDINVDDILNVFPELAESEDEKVRKDLIGFFRDGGFLYHKKEEIVEWLEKQGEQKPFDYENANIQQKDFAPNDGQKPAEQQMYWSEEEIEPIISDYLCGREHYGGMIGRLCHLKPKQKQTEWGEDDEVFLDDILCKLEHDLILNKDEKDWLKSLRPQNKWKPSDVQIECLSDAIEHYNSLGYPASKLKELLDDLKELKGEV